MNLPQIKTRISTYEEEEDDNTVLYAYEPNAKYINKKPLGYAFKNYNYLLAKKMRYRKMKKREAMSSFSYPESYSPTTPVGRREIDSQSNNEETSYQSQEYQEPEQSSPHREFERPTPTQSPLPASFFPSQGYQPYFTSDDVVPGTSAVSCFASPGAHSGSSMLSSPSFIAVPDPSVLKQGFSKDPSTWSVEEVIQFMRHTDPQISGPLADLFRQHDIDGKALLLLKNDMMMQYMGLKLGTVVKLSHYVDKLKEKHFNF
ncbi:Sex comb on midleg-like protein 2 [Tupaia chinensis]|uniref:Sex comb on midleg-like protein 2 n=1 Tax=Tupaia chinensis TaxID=246437 RepID=L9JDR6_TUPCH|nr:Sex comb on midleg-like protein 2 [Tupaia chinensis]